MCAKASKPDVLLVVQICCSIFNLELWTVRGFASSHSISFMVDSVEVPCCGGTKFGPKNYQYNFEVYLKYTILQPY